MKTTRSHTFRKITRAFYLLGVVFLLAGMFLSVINVPAQAGSAPGSAYQATRLPPGSVVKPPSVQPPVVKPPVAPPVVAPGSNPSTPPQGPGAQGVNRGPSAMATPIMRSGPSTMAIQVPGASVRFNQANYCYAGAAGPVNATVEISLPEGVQAKLNVDWYVVWPRTGEITHHYFTPDQIFEDGDSYTYAGQWPGIGSWTPGNTVEIHFGAILLDVDESGPISDGAGLDLFYNGGCNPRPPVVLSPTCQEDGILWTLSNPSAASVPFTYTVNGQPGGSGTIPPSGSTTFTTVGGGTTVVVTYDNGLGGTATVTGTASENCGVVLQPLTLSHACTANGVTWTVTNPNASAANFTWSLDGAQTGSGSAPANSSVTVTSAANTAVAHTLTLTSSLGTVTNSSTANECTQEEAQLTVLHACLDATNTIQWQVRNDSTVDTNFSWSLDGGPSTSSFVSAGQTVNVTTSSSGAHSLVVTWSTGSATGTSAAGFCAAAPPSITLRHACDTQTNGILWYATNTGASTTLVDWSLDNGATSGNVSIPAGQEVLLTTSTSGAHTMQVTFGNNIVVTDSSLAGECGTTILLPLTISYACVVGQNSLEWTVTNPNDTAVTFRWAQDGGALSDPLMVSANGTLMFHTSTSTTAHTIRITWVNPSGAPDGEAQLSSPADACGTITPPPPPSLSLAYACVDVNNIQWTAVNPGATPVTFNWVLDTNAQSGSGTAPAGGQANFLVTDTNAHTVSITWSTTTGTLSVSRTSPADVCDVVVTDTPTPTPTATFTNTPTATVTATFTNTPTATVTSIITATNTATATPTTEIIVTNTPTATNTPGTGITNTPVTSFTSTPGTGPSSTPVTSFTNTPGIPVTGGTATQTGGTAVVGTTVAGTTVAGTVIVGLAQGTSTPGPTSTPIAEVGVPITGSGADQQSLAGAYGADMSHPTGAALWQQILLNGGLLFFGLGLIFEGLGRKLR